MFSAVELPSDAVLPITVAMDQVGVPPVKPEISEVLLYAEKQVDKYIKDHAAHLPREQKQEVAQEALLRVANAYAEIDPTRGWKSFVQFHSRGAVLDYLRDGTGFKENKWDDQGAAEATSNESEKTEGDAEDGDEALTPQAPRKFKQRLTQRVSVVNSDDDRALDVEAIAGIFGIHSEAEESNIFKPRWDLVARMAQVDPEIHLVAKILRGFTQTELAPGFEVTREMLSQRIRIFFKKLDDPDFYHSKWIAQAIYAFGLSEMYNMDPEDQGVGWEYDPVDLDSKDSLALMSLFHQLSFEF